MASRAEINYPIPSQPRQVRLDTTTRCNARCLSCHRFLSDRKGEMPFDLIEKLLKDIAKWPEPLSEIVPVNYGEFFLREDWLEILSLIAQFLPSTEITIPTNGSRMDDKVVLKLSSIPNFKIVNFSVNAYFDETYEAFNGLKADTIPRVRQAVAQLRILRPDVRLKASMVFDPAYQSDLERDYFINYWTGWAEPWVIPAASAGRGTEIKIERHIPCRSLFSDFVVGFDGKLSSCCFDAPMKLDCGFYSGDLRKDWHNGKLERLRKLHNQGRRNEIPLCQNCTFE